MQKIRSHQSPSGDFSSIVEEEEKEKRKKDEGRVKAKKRRKIRKQTDAKKAIKQMRREKNKQQ